MLMIKVEPAPWTKFQMCCLLFCERVGSSLLVSGECSRSSTVLFWRIVKSCAGAPTALIRSCSLADITDTEKKSEVKGLLTARKQQCVQTNVRCRTTRLGGRIEVG